MPAGTPKQPQHYCRNCGTEVRPENAFCTSCGARMPRTERSDQTHPRSTPSPAQPGSFIDSLRDTFRGIAQQLRGAFSVFRGGGNLRGMPLGAMRWFKDLPVVSKAVLIGLVLLALLVLLSPLAIIAAVLLFWVSVIALIGWERRSHGRWPIVAVASLVLALVFAGVFDAFYGGISLGNSEAKSNESIRAAREDAEKSKDAPYDGEAPSYPKKATTGKKNGNPVDVYLVYDDRILPPGSVFVNRKSSNYSAFYSSGVQYDRGHAQSNGIMVSQGGIMSGSKVGDLDRLDYACTYDAEDPRGREEAIREACGFSIELAN